MNRLLLTTFLLLSGAGAAPAQELFPLQAVTSSGSDCSSYSGSNCPPGYTWTNTIDDEFTGSGSVGDFASDGVNWGVVPPSAVGQVAPKWYTGRIDGQEWFYDDIFGGYTAMDCKDMVYESGGYLHIVANGSIRLPDGTSSNPAHGCEPNTDVNPEPSGGGIFIEAYVNYSQSLEYPDYNWMTSKVPTTSVCGTSAGWEVDIMEVNKSAVFWCDYAASTTIGFTSGWQTGWHEIGMQIEDTSGLTIWVDGAQQGTTQNPFGCSTSAPCVQTQPYTMRFTDGGTGGTGSLAQWFRVFTHN